MKLKIGVLPAEAKENLGTVLQRMKAGRELIPYRNGYGDCRIVRCELPASNVKLVNDEFIPTGTTKVIANRAYEIENETGTVSIETDPCSSLFISASKALKKVSGIIENIKNNFDNPDVVQQFRLEIHCFNKDFIERFQRLGKN